MARICVWIFVFVSAYGLSLKYKKYQGNNLVFVLQNWLGLMKKWWIVYFLFVILYACFCGNVFQYYECSWKYIVFDFFEWNDLFDMPRVFGSWYLCFAQILMLFIPFLYIICEKLGWITLPIIFILMQFSGEGIVSTGGGDYLKYFLTAVLGVLCAQTGMIDKLMERLNKRWVQVVVGALELIFVIAILRWQYYTPDFGMRYVSSILSMVAAFLICMLVTKCSGIVERILAFFGKHSAVMFMTNVMLYIEFSDVVFATHNPIVSYLTLVTLTVLFSCVADFLGKKSGYNKLFDKMNSLIERKRR